MGGGIRVPQSNTFALTTAGGTVIIDTSAAAAAPVHRKLLQPIVQGSIRAIVLTHAHGDHTGGIALWRQPATEVIAQRSYPEFLDYTARLSGYFGRSNAAQFGGGAARGAGGRGAQGSGRGAANEPTVLFDATHRLQIGDTQLELLHTPGETPDHLTVWVPRLRAAFVGDNFYDSFPNLYTLRGTRPRWALDYVSSLNKVLALEPEMVLPSHGAAIRGRDEVRRRLTKYRDAILYAHDATVRGMNEGKDIVTLMREIKLPADLEIGESYGKLTWSIRGIYEGYVGWFDGNVSTMFGPASQAYGEIVKLAGGAAAVAARASALVATAPLQALYLTDMVLAGEPDHRATLEARLRALRVLAEQSTNSNERGWLAAAIRDAEARLKR